MGEGVEIWGALVQGEEGETAEKGRNQAECGEVGAGRVREARI